MKPILSKLDAVAQDGNLNQTKKSNIYILNKNHGHSGLTYITSNDWCTIQENGFIKR